MSQAQAYSTLKQVKHKCNGLYECVCVKSMRLNLSI